MAYDTEIFNNNPDVIPGDRCILFKTRGNEYVALPHGFGLAVGDTIVVHKDINGDLITHGNNRIGVGDKVIVVPLADGDLAALNPGTNPWRDCPIVEKTTFPKGEFHDPPDDTMQHMSYSIELTREIDPFETMNVRFDFTRGCDTRGFQNWYPCGGVWLGFGAANTNGTLGTGSWFWPAGDPYATIRGQPMITLDGSTMCIAGYQSNDFKTWCIPNFLQTLYPYGRLDWPVKWIHVHISTNSTLFWKNYTRSDMLHATICAGGPVRDGWCSELTANQQGLASSAPVAPPP